MRLLRRAWVLALFAVSCFSPSYHNGGLVCGSGSSPCPSGYHCAADQTCWQNGSDPTPVTPPKHQGDACAAGDVCDTGQCVDGFCCDSPCTGACQTCSATPGTCTLVTGAPATGRSCNGQGTTCAGTCGGSSPDCTYPAAGTICGAACDGKCDNAGSCSSVAGGSCPGFFACGPSGCLTACTSDNDCQPNFFTCFNQQCFRKPESDCLDGKDNNGDGLADCMDPTCAPQVSCVPVGPSGSQLGVVDPSCPSGFGPGLVEKTGFQDSSCGGCTCTTAPICQVEIDVHSGTGGCGGGGPNVVPAGPPGTEACVNFAAGLYTQFYTFGVITAGHSCTVGGMPTRPTPTFATTTNFCPASRTSATCADSSHVCVPKPPATKTICVSMPGNVSGCPTGFSSGPTTYAQNASPGSCGACPASCTAGSTPNCSGSATAYVHTGASCTGTAAAGGTNACSTINGGAQVNVQSAGASFSSDGSADTCSVTQPASNPSTLIGQTTVCCM